MRQPVSSDGGRRLRELRRDMTAAAHGSRESLNRALGAAWRMGQLLRAEKPRVRRRMGRDAWPSWLAANFPDSRRVAERWMNLARAFGDERELHALSLRQAYFRLGIPTEPKKRRPVPTLALPSYLRSAQRLLVSVRMRLRLRQMNAIDHARLRADLAPLRRQLDALFAPRDD